MVTQRDATAPAVAHAISPRVCAVATQDTLVKSARRKPTASKSLLFLPRRTHNTDMRKKKKKEADEVERLFFFLVDHSKNKIF
jgi:hypothetical protein